MQRLARTLKDLKVPSDALQFQKLVQNLQMENSPGNQIDLDSFLFVVMTQLLLICATQKSQIKIAFDLSNEAEITTNLQSYMQDLFEILPPELQIIPPIFNQFPPNSQIILKNLIQLLDQYLDSHRSGHSGEDFLGPLLLDLIPPKLRKRTASYYSTPFITKFILDQLIVTGEEHVCDPACGSGQLLVGAYLRKQQLNSSRPPEQLLKEIAGTDISPFAIYVATLNLFLLYPQPIRQQMPLKHSDAFEHWQNTTERFEIMVANPPFTKKQQLSPETKKILKEYFPDVEKIPDIGLHFYFLLLAIRLVVPGGKVGLIVPVNISYSDSGRPILMQFLHEFTIRMIVTSDRETSFSHGSNLEELVIIAEKKESSTEPDEKKVLCISLQQVLTRENVAELNTLVRNPDMSSPLAHISKVSQRDLINSLENHGWAFLHQMNELGETLRKFRKNLIPLENASYLEKKRGVNLPTDFFFLPNPYWTVEKITASHILIARTAKIAPYPLGKSNIPHQLAIPSPYFVPLIRKPEYYKNKILLSPELSSENFLFAFPKNGSLDTLEADIRAYIEFGRTGLHVHERSNTRNHLDRWFSLGDSEFKAKQAQLFLTFKWDPRYRAFLVNYSPDPITYGQAFWGLKCRNPEIASSIAWWFDSTVGMAFLFENANFQRKIWRQLAGDLLLQVPLPAEEIFQSFLSIPAIIELQNQYIKCELNIPLIEQLEYCLQALIIVIQYSAMQPLENPKELLIENGISENIILRLLTDIIWFRVLENPEIVHLEPIPNLFSVDLALSKRLHHFYWTFLSDLKRSTVQFEKESKKLNC
jgi:hypothetical protein